MAIDYNSLRNKSIDELKKDIFFNRQQLAQLRSKKIYLMKLSQNNTPKGPIEIIYSRIFNFNEDNKNSEAQKELEQCSWEEETVIGNLGKLEQEKRMKELAKVNDWWKANEELIIKNIKPHQLENFKKQVFEQLINELEKDEISFIQNADRILLDLLDK